MNLVHYLLVLSIYVFVLFSVNASFSDSEEYNESDDPKSICKYKRSAELQRECSPVLSSLASKTKFGNDKFYRAARDLSFSNADWMQEPNGLPLMPFDDTDMPHYNISSFETLLKLASFWIMGIDFAHQSDTTVGLCGLLSIGLTRNRTLSDRPHTWTPWFHKSPGYSDLTVVFEGLYAESEETGERLMCLLGTTLFPFSDIYGKSYKFWAKHHSCKQDQVPDLKNDQIMLVLRYPQKFNLTNRAILGELRSLHRKSDAMYFDKVHISSMFNHESKYQFTSEELLANACKDSSCHDAGVDEYIHFSKGSDFCKAFQKFANSETFDIVVDANCNGKYYNTLGPFLLERNLEGTNQTLDKLKLILSNYRCVPAFLVANHYTLQARSGLSGMTISAEGTWDSSTGQLCMIGCIGSENGSDKCKSRICIHFPKTFSITQRRIFIGTISSISATDSYAPLIFKRELRPQNLWNYYNEYTKSHLVYKYSKIEMATELLKRNKKIIYGALKKLLILRYPFILDHKNITALSVLSSELGFGAKVLPKIFHNRSPIESVVRLEVLTLGTMFGFYWENQKVQTCQVKSADSSASSASTEDRLHLNVSAQLSLNGANYNHISELFVEGLYDPSEGKMHLIGCRNVPKSEKFSSENLSLENNMDCSIEVKVEYTSKTTRWLINPTAKVTILSQREETNPLYFRPISLNTAVITYIDNSKEVSFRQNFEVLLRLMVLSSIAFILRQLSYVNQKAESIHFISLVMLGVQIISYTLPLVVNIEILFKWKEYQYPKSRSIYITRNIWLHSSMKFILLVAFVLTLRLFQKVWDSRKLPKNSLHWKKIPDEKRILFSTLMIHIVGFLVVYITKDSDSESVTKLRTYRKMNDLEKYMGVVEDMFLVPQIVGNMQWQIQGKALSKVYYIGFSVLRFVVRGYDYIRDPIFNNSWHEYDSVISSVFFTKSENVVMMVIVVTLAVIVHVQQSSRH